MNKTTKKKWLNYVLAPALMLVLLWLIYRQIQSKGDFAVQWADFKHHWQEGNKLLLLAVALLAPANWTLEAIKWKMLLQKIEPLPFRKAFASTLTGIAFSLITPNKIGDFAGRILYLDDKNKLRAAIATLISNLSQTLVTYGFGIAGLVYFNITYPGSWPRIALAAALLSAALLLLLYLRIDKVAGWAEHRPWLRKVIVSIRILKRYSRKDLLQLLGISFIRFCVYNLQFLLLANVLGAGLPWAAGFLLSGLMFWLITVIPSIFLADLGVRGYVAGLLFTDTGIAANSMAILAGSYMIWLLNLVVPAIIGSLLLITIRIAR
ncbi:lysylphosphatidylglycerol synthase domain-containing protein [Taibaiella helva]|uniref:lysylphosphatidylglycerol synthase domain-containing protein n=1 Tax=Taibaiella helva TaxID=2301235 RepID=UPI000E57294B|nr:lysylphosphatidylglycerol synthase domain-containing protein [Taibaiella helva]